MCSQSTTNDKPQRRQSYLAARLLNTIDLPSHRGHLNHGPNFLAGMDFWTGRGVGVETISSNFATSITVSLSRFLGGCFFVAILPLFPNWNYLSQLYS